MVAIVVLQWTKYCQLVKTLLGGGLVGLCLINCKMEMKTVNHIIIRSQRGDYRTPNSNLIFLLLPTLYWSRVYSRLHTSMMMVNYNNTDISPPAQKASVMQPARVL